MQYNCHLWNINVGSWNQKKKKKEKRMKFYEFQKQYKWITNSHSWNVIHRNTAAVRQSGDRVRVAVTTNSAAYRSTPPQGGAYPTPPPPQTHTPQYSLAYRHPVSTAMTPQQPLSYQAMVPQDGAYHTQPPPQASTAVTPLQPMGYPPPPSGKML